MLSPILASAPLSLRARTALLSLHVGRLAIGIHDQRNGVIAVLLVLVALATVGDDIAVGRYQAPAEFSFGVSVLDEFHE